MKFRSDTDGYICGLRFYKGSNNTGTHVGSLWNNNGTLLAQATFTGESASGWQQVDFAAPVAITANTVYVASYHAPNGKYSIDQGYFASAGVENAPLYALEEGVSGGNGVYSYGSGGFPANTWNASNYWVDVVFTSGSPPVADSDSDSDGVSDAADQCSNTPADEVVDISGCSASQRDGDGDSVNDAADQCPETQAGASVDSSGCSASQVDSDGDGVSDEVDECPNTPAGEAVDISGCSASQVDSDSDGVSDEVDECPNTPAGEAVDISGCSASQVDSGGDGPALVTDLLEVGEVEIDDGWQRIDFRRTFVDAIVVAKPLSVSANEYSPATVRIRNIDSTGFEIRVQEWDYLDGFHDLEVVSYLAMESGRHQLADGSLVEAGRIQTGATNAFVATAFEARFEVTPVVLTAVTSVNEGEAVTTRVRNIDRDGFEVGLREQEANAQTHAEESIDYIAWEPSSGIIDGVEFEVGRTDNVVTDDVHYVPYGDFAVPPVFLADMQTKDGGDTANLRLRNKSAGGVEVWIDEEKSMDLETGHTTEIVGYLAMDPSLFAQDATEIEVFADSFEVSEWNGLWTEDGQNDWFGSSQRATDGNRSAEVDGNASDATLTSIPIDLQGRRNATIDFSWLIESRLDSNEYLAFDASFDGGVTWTEQHRLRGNQDQENVWHAERVELTDIDQLRIRFRGRMNSRREDANVDEVTVIAH